MPTFKTVLLCLSLASPMAFAQSTNIDLLSFATSDAKIVAGANVDAAKNSDFGQFVIAQVGSSNPALQKFIDDTHIDPRTDISEILAVTNGTPGPGFHPLIAAHGAFGKAIAAIEALATANGGTISHLGNVDVIQVDGAQSNAGGQTMCVGLYTDGGTAVIGECDALKAAVQAAGSKPAAGSALLTAAQTIRGLQDLWFVSVAAIPQFGNALPGGMNVMNSALLQAIQQTSGGVKFLSGSSSPEPSVQVSGDALMDTPANATSLMNVANFLVSMIQMQGNSHQVLAAFQTLLSSFKATASGNTLHVSMTVSQMMLEQLFQQMHQQVAVEHTPKSGIVAVN